VKVYQDHNDLLREIRQANDGDVSLHFHNALADVRGATNDTIFWGTGAMAYLSCRSDQTERSVDMMIHVEVRDGKILGYRWLTEPLE
jgi:hypothetical protein